MNSPLGNLRFVIPKLFVTARCAALATILALCCLAVPGRTLGQTLENFDEYANTAALNANVVQTQGATTVTLGMTDGVGGSKALNVSVNNGSSPFFGDLKFALTPFTLTGIQAVTVQISFLGGSNEQLHLTLLDSSNNTLATGPTLGTQSIVANPSYQTYTIPTIGLTSTVSRIEFLYGASDFGTTSVAFDNITAVAPEGSTSAFLAVGGIILVVLRSRLARTIVLPSDKNACA